MTTGKLERITKVVSGFRSVAMLCCALFAVAGIGCQTIKPYEKEHLLNPLMDDKGLGGLNSPFAGASLTAKDFLASGSPQASATSSCPTCGG